jgi:hypothetical protein
MLAQSISNNKTGIKNHEYIHVNAMTLPHINTTAPTMLRLSDVKQVDEWDT